MLNSLYINNYRNLKDLKISTLGRVNLITGKNNTGKSTILEAIAIYASGGDLNIINELLKERGEALKDNYGISDRHPFGNNNINAFSSIFNNRKIGFDKNDAILIGTLENTIFADENISDKVVSIRFIQFSDEIIRDSQGPINKRIISHFNQRDENLKIGFEIRNGNNSNIQSLESARIRTNTFFDKNDKFEFIGTRNIDKENNGKLWDEIVFTEKEQYAIEALKIIEPFVERIAFIGENPRSRTAVIKLSNSSTVLPLRSMGDGINRILTIILGLVNAENGFLLIDEFETGLHYSVQEKLWEIIFVIAEKLKIQVFVTTHSNDCILSYEKVLNNIDIKSNGNLIRLDNINGTIKQVAFDAKELQIANDNEIDIR